MSFYSIFHQLANQFPARVIALLFSFHLSLLVHRQEFPALDVHERGSHHEEFARDLQVELAHQVDVFDELGGEFGEVDVVNADLFLFNEVKEQIQRAFKNLELNFVFRHARLKT